MTEINKVKSVMDPLQLGYAPAGVGLDGPFGRVTVSQKSMDHAVRPMLEPTDPPPRRTHCPKCSLNFTSLIPNTKSAAPTMTTISKDSKLVTLINVFTVEPAKQQQLVDLLVHATETAMRHLPGFISANIHRSLDGKKVVNYAQWRSVEDFEAMQNNPAARPHMEQAAAFAGFQPGLYEVVDTQSAPPSV